MKLKNATLNSLQLADEQALGSICSCAISTGIFGCPMDRCADIMLKTVKGYLSGMTGLKQIVFCLYDKIGYDTFEVAMKNFFIGMA